MFATTEWTVVFRAAKERSDSAGKPALSSILEKYWHPLYVYARQQGLSASDAEDATQGFLAELIQGELLEKADPARGRFRNYLLAAWKRYLIDLHRSEGRQKRGGECRIISIDLSGGESQWSALVAKEQSPDTAFLKSWANTIVTESIERLRMEYHASNRKSVFEQLLPMLTAPVDRESYDEISRNLLITANAAKVALHRFRQRFAETLRDVLRETIEDPEELESELDELLAVLSST